MLAEIKNPSLKRVLDLEDAIAQMPEQVTFEPKHYFSGGVYARELFIPKGVVVTGQVHKGDHLFFVMSGDLEVMTDDGVKRIKGPSIMLGKAGIKRVAYAYEDTICVAVHATKQTNVSAVEDELVEPLRPHIEDARQKNIGVSL
jgi:quercetin dioxygenase-like cupin family protein